MSLTFLSLENPQKVKFWNTSMCETSNRIFVLVFGLNSSDSNWSKSPLDNHLLRIFTFEMKMILKNLIAVFALYQGNLM